MSRFERKAQIDSKHPLPVSRQCKLLEISRTNAYYQPAAISDEKLKIMRLLDELHLNYPFYGSRRLRDAMLDEYGVVTGRQCIRSLMLIMGISATYPGKGRNTSAPGKGHKIYPYLLKGIDINRSNQVWCADITYIPMRKGFAYLVAVMDWHSRKVLSWRLSNVMDAAFCVEALEEAIMRFGRPCVFNTDQGSQFTSEVFTKVLIKHGIQISMDGKGRWVDNVMIERLWRSVKYEEVYLRAYDDLVEARGHLGKYFIFYNSKRRHQSLDCRPDEMYYSSLEDQADAA